MGEEGGNARFSLLFFLRARYPRMPSLVVRVLQRWWTRAVESCNMVWLSEGQIEMAPGEEGRQIEGANVITTSESLLFVSYNSRGYLKLVVSFRPLATTDTRRSILLAVRPSLSYFVQSATPVRFCGRAYLAVARANWSPKCKNSLFICDLTCASCPLMPIQNNIFATQKIPRTIPM